MIYKKDNVVFTDVGWDIISSSPCIPSHTSKGLITKWWYESTIFQKEEKIVEVIGYYSKLLFFKKKLIFVKEINYQPDIILI
jgi:hypothetical protein